MVKLEAGNILLKPSHRRQLMTWLKRSLKIGERLGAFDLTVTLAKVGNQHEVRAKVADRAGTFTCRARQREWQGAMRALVQRLCYELRMQKLRRLAA